MKKDWIAGLAIFLLAAVTWTPSCNFSPSESTSAEKSGHASGNSRLPVAPDVTFKGLSGTDVSLSSFKGKVVLVNFWATWCDPCRIEIPWMIEFQQKYGRRGFTVLGVAMDDEGKSVVQPFAEKPQFDVNGTKIAMNYPIVLGNDDVAQKFGGIIGLPTSLLISRDGKIVKRFIGLVNHDLLVKDIEGQL